MSRVILKWRVPVDGNVHEIALPLGAFVIAVDAQTPYAVEFWTESRPVNDIESRERRSFRVFPTGGHIDNDRYEHRGTAVLRGERLVWHLYELPTSGLMDTVLG